MQPATGGVMHPVKLKCNTYDIPFFRPGQMKIIIKQHENETR